MATKDLPAAFEYITNLTGKDKINYIGHSQGTMIMHAALAMRLESITSRVKHIISTGPVAYVGNVTTKLVKALMEVNKNNFYI
jgi:poly(3-hydroxyalkanoate) synthetase